MVWQLFPSGLTVTEQRLRLPDWYRSRYFSCITFFSYPLAPGWHFNRKNTWIHRPTFKIECFPVRRKIKFFQCCANIKRSNQIIHLYAICSLIKFLNDFKEGTAYIQRITNISFLIAVLFNVIKKMNEYLRQVLVHVQWCHANDFSFLIFFFILILFYTDWITNQLW